MADTPPNDACVYDFFESRKNIARGLFRGEAEDMLVVLGFKREKATEIMDRVGNDPEAMALLYGGVTISPEPNPHYKED